MNKSQLSDRYWLRYVVFLLIWAIIIGASLQGSSLLNDEIESSTNIISTDTDAAAASELINDRFNDSTSEVQHIIVLQLPNGNDDITSHKWSNYTLFLGLMVFDEITSSGYDTLLSAPIIRQQLQGVPNVDDIASEFISEDLSTGMIFISSSTLTIEDDDIALQDHVHEIRELLHDYEKLEEFVSAYATSQNIPPQVLLSFLPTEQEVNSLNQVLTGTAANIVDTLEVSEESFEQSEMIAAVVILIILIIVFRTPLGVIIPLISTVAALFPAYLLSAILGKYDVIVINSFLPAVIAMIGIAVAVDYNLFALVRYREEYRKRRASLEEEDNWNKTTRKETEVLSSKKMNATAGSAVMYSGFTVVIGFAALLLTENDFSIAMAVGVSIVVLMSIFTTRTLTPAILAFAGRFLDWPNFMSRASKDIQNYKDGSKHSSGFWVNWSKRVMRRPFVFLLIGVLIMTPFVVLSAQTDLSFSLTKSLPADTESREGFEIIQNQFNLGELNPYQVVIDAGSEENSIWNPAIIGAVNSFSQSILKYDGYYDAEDQYLEFASVTTVSALKNSTNDEMIYFNYTQIQNVYSQPDGYFVGIDGEGQPIIAPNWLKLLFVDHSKQYVNWELSNNTMIIEITSNLDPGSGAAWSLVDIIKEELDQHFTPLIDDGIVKSTGVTGFTALVKESSDGLYDRVPLMLTVAVVLIFLSLMVLFRSVILPAKAILTIAGSILFGVGTLVFIFQLGYIQLIEIFGITIWEAELSGITYFLPTFLFTTILGLGMDYSIFIISRIKEEYERTGNMDESVGLGLAKTAGIITSAATIMTLTFLVFAVSPMLTLKMMGLAMAVAIVVDATIARTILLPAAMRLAGKYNFWLPKWLQKILPEIELEH